VGLIVGMHNGGYCGVLHTRVTEQQVVTPTRVRSRGKAIPSYLCVHQKILKNASSRVTKVITDIIVNEKQ